MIIGAICGDIAGSPYEQKNIKYILPEDSLLSNVNCHFTDDTVMTCAVANALLLSCSCSPLFEDTVIKKNIIAEMQRLGRLFPKAGYGYKFNTWLNDPNPQPYGSWGNGSAMRVSAAGWIAHSLSEAERIGELSASVTHNHPDGLLGARAIAGCIYILRQNGSKSDIVDYVSPYYDINFSLAEIRPRYTFDVSCKGSIPQAIRAFLEGSSFSEVISLAISIGGDSDTIAAIAGSMAEVIYPIPEFMISRAKSLLPYKLRSILHRTDPTV